MLISQIILLYLTLVISNVGFILFFLRDRTNNFVMFTNIDYMFFVNENFARPALLTPMNHNHADAFFCNKLYISQWCKFVKVWLRTVTKSCNSGKKYYIFYLCPNNMFICILLLKLFWPTLNLFWSTDVKFIIDIRTSAHEIIQTSDIKCVKMWLRIVLK